jgi:dipeptidyl-peptidase-3
LQEFANDEDEVALAEKYGEIGSCTPHFTKWLVMLGQINAGVGTPKKL